MPVSVLIVSDVTLYRDGLGLALGSRGEIGTIFTARDVWEAVGRVSDDTPDVILLDLSMTGAMSALASLSRRVPEATIIALAVPAAEEDVIACAEAGDTGYVTRDGSLEDLISTILSTRQGRLNCSSRISAALFRRLSVVAAEHGLGSEGSNLSPREIQILQLIEQGFSNKEISRSLGIEVTTVKNHVHHILEKLKVSRRGEAAAALRRMI